MMSRKRKNIVLVKKKDYKRNESGYRKHYTRNFLSLIINVHLQNLHGDQLYSNKFHIVLYSVQYIEYLSLCIIQNAKYFAAKNIKIYIFMHLQYQSSCYLLHESYEKIRPFRCYAQNLNFSWIAIGYLFSVSTVYYINPSTIRHLISVYV